MKPSGGVGRSVCHNFLLKTGSYTVLLLSEHFYCWTGLRVSLLFSIFGWQRILFNELIHVNTNSCLQIVGASISELLSILKIILILIFIFILANSSITILSFLDKYYFFFIQICKEFLSQKTTKLQHLLNTRECTNI